MSDTHDRGLAHDLKQLERMAGRRQVLRWMAGAALIPLVGCGATGSLGGDGGSCGTIPEETGGPFPGDGSNGVNALALSGIVRSDLRSSFAGSTGTAEGVPLTLELSLVDSSVCGTLAGYAIYAWHCDRDGKYSMYDLPAQNYLRGVQETDANGLVTFSTIFPACYSGRWPHIHFEIYPNLSSATASGNKLRTSQLALPQATCNEVFATTGYSASVANLAKTSLTSDMVFSDGVQLQVPTITGNVTDGYRARLTVGIAV